MDSIGAVLMALETSAAAGDREAAAFLRMFAPWVSACGRGECLPKPIELTHRAGCLLRVGQASLESHAGLRVLH